MKNRYELIIIATLTIAIAGVPGLASAQNISEQSRCADTLKQLDRALSALSERIERQQAQSEPMPTARVILTVLDMDALASHLRCLGLDQDSAQ